MDEFIGKSKYHGVTWLKLYKKWQVQIRVNKKCKYLGSFAQEMDAAICYDEFIKANNLKQRLNFPEPEPKSPIPNTRLIRLTQGKFAVVDEEDYEELNKYKWHVIQGHSTFYAKTNIKIGNKWKLLSLHQMIMGDIYIDHINGDGLHNYKSNLRKCTNQQNQMNQRKHKNTTSIYKGVGIRKNGQIFAVISIDKKRVELGRFKSEIDAAIAYNNAAIKYYGEFAKLNEIMNLP